MCFLVTLSLNNRYNFDTNVQQSETCSTNRIDSEFYHKSFELQGDKLCRHDNPKPWLRALIYLTLQVESKYPGVHVCLVSTERTRQRVHQSKFFLLTEQMNKLWCWRMVIQFLRKQWGQQDGYLHVIVDECALVEHLVHCTRSDWNEEHTCDVKEHLYPTF